MNIPNTDNSSTRCIYLFTLLLITSSVVAQPLTLDECYALAEQESPLAGQANLYGQLAMVKHEKITAANLPQVDISGQWTYQSAVFGLPVKLPNADIPTIPNGQYQAYLSVEQNLYDGGVSRQSKVMVQRELKVNQQKV